MLAYCFGCAGRRHRIGGAVSGRWLVCGPLWSRVSVRNVRDQCHGKLHHRIFPRVRSGARYRSAPTGGSFSRWASSVATRHFRPLSTNRFACFRTVRCCWARYIFSAVCSPEVSLQSGESYWEAGYDPGPSRLTVKDGPSESAKTGDRVYRRPFLSMADDPYRSRKASWDFLFSRTICASRHPPLGMGDARTARSNAQLRM